MGLLLDTALEEEVLNRYPAVIADAFDALTFEESSRAQRDKIVECFRIAIRLIGITSLAVVDCSRAGKGGKQLLHKMLSKGLTDGEWVGLARELLRPYAEAPDELPFPELVSIYFRPGTSRPANDAKVIDRLLKMRRSETVAHGSSGTMQWPAH